MDVLTTLRYMAGLGAFLFVASSLVVACYENWPVTK